MKYQFKVTRKVRIQRLDVSISNVVSVEWPAVTARMVAVLVVVVGREHQAMRSKSAVMSGVPRF